MPAQLREQQTGLLEQLWVCLNKWHRKYQHTFGQNGISLLRNLGVQNWFLFHGI
jgi:hypothetical protein